jgi:hypothetical protein
LPSNTMGPASSITHTAVCDVRSDIGWVLRCHDPETEPIGPHRLRECTHPQMRNVRNLHPHCSDLQRQPALNHTASASVTRLPSEAAYSNAVVAWSRTNRLAGFPRLVCADRVARRGLSSNPFRERAD